MQAPTELIKGNAAVLILSCLAREPMHGYRIAKELKEHSEGYFSIGEGTLYPQLRQLEKDGMIEGYWESAPSGRERRLYRITDRGMAKLAKSRQELELFQANLMRVLDLAPGHQQ